MSLTTSLIFIFVFIPACVLVGRLFLPNEKNLNKLGEYGFGVLGVSLVVVFVSLMISVGLGILHPVLVSVIPILAIVLTLIYASKLKNRTDRLFIFFNVFFICVSHIVFMFIP